MSKPEHGVFHNVGNKFEDANFPSANTINHGFNNIKNSHLEQSFNDSLKYLDQHRMLMEQENAVMALKISEYEKALSEKDFSIESLHTDIVNYQNENCILTNQFKSIMESTKSLNSTGIRLNTCFNNISERLNRLGDTLENVKKRQKEIMTTNSAIQEKVAQESLSIDSLFDQVNIERAKANEELDKLKNKYSLECNTYKTNLEECNKEIANLKSENDSIAGFLNAANIKLNEEKQSVINKNQYLEDAVNQNALLMNDIKVLTDKYDNILAENQSLKDELAKINILLNENKMQLELKQKTIDDLTELFVNIKQSEELNDILKNDNFTLREHNEHLEKTISDLMNDISNNIVYQSEIQDENEIKFNHMCKKYDETLKMYEEKILHLTETIELQKENECTNQNEVIQLKHNVQMSNNTITNLQEELMLNLTSISELQNKIESLNNELTINNKKLQDCTTEFETERFELEYEKIKLKNQIKQHHVKLTEKSASYIKYKSMVIPLYLEVLKLRQKCFLFQQQKSPEQTETIEITSRKENEDAVRNNEFVGEDVSNKNRLNVSYSMSLSPPNCPSKRNSPNYVDNISLKKHKTSTNKSACQVSSPEKENNMENKSKNQVDSIPNVAVKKSYKIPTDIRLPRNKLKSTFMHDCNLPKPNSPVPITKPSPTKKT